MTYYSGMLAAVPKANRQAYADHARAAWPIFSNLGATRMVESWGVDVPAGKVTDFYRAVQAKEDEAIVFSWIEWPDRDTADKAFAAMMSGEAGQDMPEMPFDGARMIFGGFDPLMTGGADKGGYYQGFALAVPATNKDTYAKMAGEVWEDMFKPLGCLGNYELWGADVPHGKQTDFYRATKAEEGEVIVFAFTVWPDRATCDAAARKMEESMGDTTPQDMPFDGKRMMWGGFEPLYDTADA